MDEQSKREILKAMAALMLQFCHDGVKSITVHADNLDGCAYVSAIAWGNDAESKYPLWDWCDFPEGE